MNVFIKVQAISLFVCLLAAFSVQGQSSIEKQKKTKFKATITGELHPDLHVDSVQLIVEKDNRFFDDFIPPAYFTAPVREGKFTISIEEDIDHPVYISLWDPSTRSLRKGAFFEKYVMEKDDSVYVKIGKEPNDRSFSGKGAMKYACKLALDVKETSAQFLMSGNSISTANNILYRMCIDSLISGSAFNNGILPEKFKLVNWRRDSLLAVLGTFKQKLSTPIYQLFYTDIISRIQTDLFTGFYGLYIRMMEPGASMDRLRAAYEKHFVEIENIPDSVLAWSYFYPDYVVYKLIESNRFNEKKMTAEQFYGYLKKTYHGEVRQKILTYYFRRKLEFEDNMHVLISDALNTVIKKEEYRTFLEQARTLVVGAPAYNFSLPDVNGKQVRLSDFKGKVVFIDFYYNGCGGCIQYHKNVVAPVKEKFKNNSKVVFMTVSIDKTKEKWLEGINSGKYTSSQAVNLYTDGQADNHPLIKKYMIRSYPRPMLIGKSGNLFQINGISLGQGPGRGDDRLVMEIEKALAAK